MIKETFFSFLHYISELGAHYVEGLFLNQWSIINQSLRGILSAGLLIGKEGLDQTASFILGHGVTSFLSFYLWPTNTLISNLSSVKVKVTQSCLTLCNSIDYMVHGILQARILEWVAVPFSKGSSQPRDQTQVFCIAGGFLTTWATREAQEYWSGEPIPSPADFPDPGTRLGSPALQVDSSLVNVSQLTLVSLHCKSQSNVDSTNNDINDNSVDQREIMFSGPVF